MNILVTGAWQDAKQNMKTLEEMGHAVAFLQYEKDELPCSYDWAEGVICNGLFLFHEIEKFTNLKYIQLTSAGYDRVPLDYIKQNNIKIHNARGVYSIPMAEYTVCAILQFYKQTSFFLNNQKERKWIKNRELKELYDQTVCIIGCGSVGTECAKRLKAFGCHVTGIDNVVNQNEYFDEIHHINSLSDSLSKADILILTLPLTDETRHLMNQNTFACMKEDSLLVNISRGALIETKTLCNALDTKLKGAVLDVFEEEPLNENSPLWDKNNVLITPHNSFVGNNNQKRLTEVILNGLRRK